MITADSVLTSLETLIFKEVMRFKDEKTALACAQALFDCLYLNFRRQLMYIPTSDQSSKQQQYEEIYNEFNGRNHKELAVKHRLSLPTIYAITKRMKTRHMRKIQNDLFPLPEEEQKKPITLVVVEQYLPNELQNCGLSEKESNFLSEKISAYLCANYPGVSICISDTLRKKRAKNNQNFLF